MGLDGLRPEIHNAKFRVKTKKTLETIRTTLLNELNSDQVNLGEIVEHVLVFASQSPFESVREAALHLLLLIVERDPSSIDSHGGLEDSLLKLVSPESDKQAEEIRLLVFNIFHLRLGRASLRNTDEIIKCAIIGLQDSFPDIVTINCSIIDLFAQYFPADLSPNVDIISPLLICLFKHKIAAVRQHAIQTFASVSSITPKAIESSDIVDTLFKPSLDKSHIVRKAMYETCAYLQMKLVDRYSFACKLLPAVLIGCMDEVVELREHSADLMKSIGALYVKDYEKELKDELDSLELGSSLAEANVGIKHIIQDNTQKFLALALKNVSSWDLSLQIGGLKLLWQVLKFSDATIVGHVAEIMLALTELDMKQHQELCSGISRLLIKLVGVSNFIQALEPQLKPEFAVVRKQRSLYLLRQSLDEYVLREPDAEVIFGYLSTDCLHGNMDSSIRMDILDTIAVVIRKLSGVKDDQFSYGSGIFNVLETLLIYADIHEDHLLSQSAASLYKESYPLINSDSITERVDKTTSDLENVMLCNVKKSALNQFLVLTDSIWSQEGLEKITKEIIVPLANHCDGEKVNVKSRQTAFNVILQRFPDFIGSMEREEVGRLMLFDIIEPNLKWNRDKNSIQFRQTAMELFARLLLHSGDKSAFIKIVLKSIDNDSFIGIMKNCLDDDDRWQIRVSALEVIKTLSGNLTPHQAQKFLTDQMLPERLEDADSRVRKLAVETIGSVVKCIIDIQDDATAEVCLGKLLLHMDDQDETIRYAIYSVISNMPQSNFKKMEKRFGEITRNFVNKDLVEKLFAL